MNIEPDPQIQKPVRVTFGLLVADVALFFGLALLSIIAVTAVVVSTPVLFVISAVLDRFDHYGKTSSWRPVEA